MAANNNSSQKLAGRFFLKLLLALTKILPKTLFRALVHALTKFSISNKFKDRAKTSLRILYGDAMDDKTLDGKAKEMIGFFLNQAVDLAYYCKKGSMPVYEDFIEGISGKEYLEEALMQQKGVIALTAHIGNFTMLTHTLTLAGFPNCATIMREQNDEKTEQLFTELRNMIGIKWIKENESKSNVLALIKFLKNNGILIMLSDQRLIGGVRVKFLGREKLTAKGPAALALRVGCPVLPIYSLATANGKNHLMIKPPILLKKTGDLEKDIFENTQIFMDEIGNIIKQHPEQWFAFSRWWRV